jgi:prepilin-type N-terminal cleavage/methylation domain-containing protein
VRLSLAGIKENRGVTLIELMIALVISAILVGGTYSIFISQQRTYVIQDQVVGVQQDARAAITIMARDIRMAGMLTGFDGFSVNGVTEAITPTNSNAGPDQVMVVYAAEEFAVSGNSVTVIDINVANNQATLSASSDSFFDTSTKKYVAFEGESHVYQISSISTNVITLTESPPDYLANFNARVFRVRAITYSVSGNSLYRNNGEETQILAGGVSQSQVEDLQIAYQIKGSTSWIYDENTSTWPVGKGNDDINVVRISLVVMTPVQDTDDQNYSRPALEDRAGSGTQDGFRRRVYTTVVKLRNV